MRGLAALGGQDPLRGEEAVHVVGLGERADEHHGTAALRPVDRVVRREHDLALGRAGRGGDARGEHVELRVRIEGGVEERVQARRVDRGQRAALVEQALADRVDREAHRGLRRSLGVARLQHVQAPLLDGELRVLHVEVVRLERAQDPQQLGVRVRHHVGHLREVARGAHAGHDVLALGVDEEVARRLGRAGHLVAAERDARARRVALVPEHHLLDVAGGAPVVGDVVDPAVGRGALADPRVEHGADRLPQLVGRVLRERLAGPLGEDRLEVVDQSAQIAGAELDVVGHAGGPLAGGDRRLERLAGDAAADVGEHLDEAPVRVPCEARVVRPRGEPFDGLVVEPEVQDRVHHPRHRFARARADRDQQRVVRVAQPLARALLQRRQRSRDLVLEAVGEPPVALHVPDACLGRDREPGRHAIRAQHARHLGHVRALPAQQLAHVAAAPVEGHDPSRVAHPGIIAQGCGCPHRLPPAARMSGSAAVREHARNPTHIPRMGFLTRPAPGPALPSSPAAPGMCFTRPPRSPRGGLFR